jgi:HlyD family secretion protein
MKICIKYLPVMFLLFACKSEEEQPDAYGSLEATETFISAELPGKLTVISALEGDKISEQQLLAQQDTSQLYLQKGKTLASIAALKAKLTNIPVQLDALKEKESLLSKEVERISLLLQNGAATSKQLDDLKGELQIVRKQRIATQNQLSIGNKAILAQIEPLEWQLKMIEDQVMKSSIKSPGNGTVLSRLKEVGEFTSPGVPIFKLANLETLTARVYLSASQLSNIKVGQEVIIKTDAASGALQSYPGTITWIADQAEFTPKTIQTREERIHLVYALKVSVPNTDRMLKIGMPVEMSF